MRVATHVMIVDDEETICEALKAWFDKDGYQVETALSGVEALERIQNTPSDIYLVDVKMPGMDGVEFLSRLKERQTDAAVIMMTAHGSIETAVQAMKRGAMDYICKPFDPEELSLLMERILAHKALKDENVALKQLLIERNEGSCDVLIAHSDPMRQICAKVEDVAPSAAPILISGETGVGKDLIARAIHLRSERCSGPFLAVNCGSLSESLLESELFGHERGAFTGAVKARRGRLEMADNGTLFLDEVGDISSKMQVSLLRALEEKSFLRLGGSQPVNSDFRLISASHRDLPSLIKTGQFREDFYYRINVITIHIPPLRERLDDIPGLADHFLKRYVEETGKPLEGFTQRALDLLTSYHWPGNVRELRNVIERAVVIARGRMIGAEELTFLNPRVDVCTSGAMTLQEVELNHIRAALDASNWNIVQTAGQLGIDRSTLMRKMKRHNFSRS